MRQISGDASAHTVDHLLRHLRIRLASNPKTEELAKPIEEMRTRIRERDESWKEAHEARVAATAQIEYLDGHLDRHVMKLARAALVVVDGKRDDPRYRRLFPVAPSQAMAGRGDDVQIAFVRGLLSRLADDGDLADLKSDAPEIKARLEALEAAISQRKQLFVPESESAVDRRQAIEDARRLYKHTYHQLQLIFDDPAFIESFFARPSMIHAAEGNAEPLDEDEPKA